VKIDLDRLTEAELIDLNRRVVERLRFLQQMRTHATMLRFSVGDRVQFQPPNRPLLTGVITRYNRQTVTILTDQREHWNVAPQLIRPADVVDGSARERSDRAAVSR
jgi:hypothetical protein